MISWEMFAFINGIEITAIGGFFWYLFQVGRTLRGEFTTEDDVLHKRISNQRERLAEIRLEVSEKYVSVDHLREVDERLVGAIQELRGDFKELREDIKDLTRALSELAVKNGHVGE